MPRSGQEPRARGVNPVPHPDPCAGDALPGAWALWPLWDSQGTLRVPAQLCPVSLGAPAVAPLAEVVPPTRIYPGLRHGRSIPDCWDLPPPCVPTPGAPRPCHRSPAQGVMSLLGLSAPSCAG